MARATKLTGPEGPLRVGQDITSLLERIETKEQHLSVTFGRMSARVAQTYDGSPVVEVLGELRSTNGPTISRATKLVVAVHDSQERVVAVMDNQAVFPEDFFEFDSFQFAVPLPQGSDIKRIRIYPSRL